MGGRKEGSRERKKRKERKLWPQLTGIKLCSVTLRKKRVVSSPPAVTQQNRYPQQAAVCAVLCVLTLEERKDASLESVNR